MQTDHDGMTGVERIAARRAKHEAKGWTAAHDDADHFDGELGDAGAFIAHHAFRDIVSLASLDYDDPTDGWALRLLREHPDPVDRLAIAGSLIAAEIDRCDRGRVADTPLSGEDA